MADNYCGKSCEECTYKEQLNCPGCAQGPGNVWTGNCKLANCCDNKGHRNCTTCGHNSSCGLLKSKHMIPKERLNNIAAEEAKKEKISKMVSKLKKWFPVLFWISIVSVITGLFTNDSMRGLMSILYNICTIVNVGCSVLYSAILLIISTESEWYKTAGIIGIIIPIASLVPAILIVFFESPIFLLLTVVLQLISLYGEYAQFKGHSEVLTEVDPELSENWEKLWKWNLIVYGALIGSIVLVLLIPALGAILAIATLIGALVIGIMKLYYLYRTSETFKYIPVYTDNN